MSQTVRAPSDRSLRARLADALGARFGVDTRALAALRISLGLLLLADLLLRARHLRALYTDSGLAPRAVLAGQYPAVRYSIHALSGAAWFQALLFVLAGLLAASLLAGYRTRTSTVLSLILLVSLHLRNPAALTGGDTLLRRLLLWGMLLPLGERWSLDARRREGAPRRRLTSVAAAGLLSQVVLVYAVNAALKHRGDLWLRGDAVRYVFSLQQFSLRLGDALTAFPSLLRAFDWFWLGLVSLSPLLVLSRGRLRTALTLMFAAAHLGMLATLRLGLFPLVSLAALLVFLPSPVWDRVETGVPASLERSAARVGDRVRSVGTRVGAGVRRPPPTVSRSLSTVRRAGRRLVPVVAAALLTFALVWNTVALGAVPPPEEEPAGLDLTQSPWSMFAPTPATVDGWYVAPGELESGERVDAFYRSAPLAGERPETRAMYPSVRWRKYLVDLRYSGDEARQRAFASYLCERWNRAHEDDLASLTVSYVEQPTRLDGPESTRRVELLQHQCRG
ncbi:HTTM domain-containing protein [Halogeometricum sp. S1BR25-6]|uniref:HTTM domain-containing protein n=1 Tax=Halogeometricum salsisoli TaxID=2950536 RepID=A0ABU2GE08_9EURY|nr:HTTM domain-containing protein [Halogeometricum sp. S1BR25-6]MDS0298343.1 HTTM domain-containing protein [Halogeometricum sp. S1BR25-6]